MEIWKIKAVHNKQATCMALVLFLFNIPHLHVNQQVCGQELCKEVWTAMHNMWRHFNMYTVDIHVVGFSGNGWHFYRKIQFKIYESCLFCCVYMECDCINLTCSRLWIDPFYWYVFAFFSEKIQKFFPPDHNPPKINLSLPDTPHLQIIGQTKCCNEP